MITSAAATKEFAALTLDDRGVVCDCNDACETLFKCRRSDLLRRHVSKLLPQLAEMDLMPNGQPNPRLRFLCRIGRQFRAVADDGEDIASELFFNVLDNRGHHELSLIVRRAADVAAACS